MTELKFGEPHADAAVNPEAERHVRARLRAIDDEAVRVLDDVAVAIDVPHHDAIVFDHFTQFSILQRSSAHMGQRRSPA